MGRKKTMDGLQTKLTDSRRVEGFIPPMGGIFFNVWSGEVRSSIQISDEAFHAAIDITAGIIYLINGDVRKFIYWEAAAVLSSAVTF